MDAPRLVIRNEPATLFTFDFERDRRFPSQHASTALEANSGPVNGIAQWIGLDLDSATSYEVCSRGPRGPVLEMIHPVDRLAGVESGRAIRVDVRHDRPSLERWASERTGRSARLMARRCG